MKLRNVWLHHIQLKRLGGYDLTLMPLMLMLEHFRLMLMLVWNQDAKTSCTTRNCHVSENHIARQQGKLEKTLWFAGLTKTSLLEVLMSVPDTYPNTISSPYFTGAFDGWFSWSGENMSLVRSFFSNSTSLIKNLGTLLSFPKQKERNMMENATS